MTTIFADESGYTGEDLVDKVQPFFILATLRSSEPECQEYVRTFFSRVKAPQLRHKILVRSGQWELIIKFLEQMVQTPELVKVCICDKKYALTRRMVDILVKPTMLKKGNDLRLHGQDYALTYDIYRFIPRLAGEAFFEDFLKRFQKMMIRMDRESYDEFFDPFFDERYPKLQDEVSQRMLDFYLDHIKSAHTSDGYSLIEWYNPTAQSLGIPRSRPIDIVFPTAMMLMQVWREGVTDSITLIYDRSDRMKEVIHLWDTHFHPNPPPALRQPGTEKSATGIAERFVQEDSKNWRGLQLADILAGATRTWIEWIHHGKKSDEVYGTRLNAVIPLLHPLMNWPRIDVTPEDFYRMGLTEEEVREMKEQADKRTAFHQLRSQGIFYRINPANNQPV